MTPYFLSVIILLCNLPSSIIMHYSGTLPACHMSIFRLIFCRMKVNFIIINSFLSSFSPLPRVIAFQLNYCESTHTTRAQHSMRRPPTIKKSAHVDHSCGLYVCGVSTDLFKHRAMPQATSVNKKKRSGLNI